MGPYIPSALGTSEAVTPSQGVSFLNGFWSQLRRC